MSTPSLTTWSNFGSPVFARNVTWYESLPNVPGWCTSSGTPPSSALSIIAFTLAGEFRSTMRCRLLIESLSTESGISESLPNFLVFVDSWLVRSLTTPDRFGTDSTWDRPSAPGSPTATVDGGAIFGKSGLGTFGVTVGSAPSCRATSSVTRTNTDFGMFTVTPSAFGVPPCTKFPARLSPTMVNSASIWTSTVRASPGVVRPRSTLPPISLALVFESDHGVYLPVTAAPPEPLVELGVPAGGGVTLGRTGMLMPPVTSTDRLVVDDSPAL